MDAGCAGQRPSQPSAQVAHRAAVIRLGRHALIAWQPKGRRHDGQCHGLDRSVRRVPAFAYNRTMALPASHSAQATKRPPAVRAGHDSSGLVPSRRQYLELKAEHPAAILLYRLGDFYETFDEDASI